jgi:hypothetical protein
MEKALRGIPMEILILVSLSMVKLMEKEFILGRIERFMMVNGIRV